MGRPRAEAEVPHGLRDGEVRHPRLRAPWDRCLLLVTTPLVVAFPSPIAGGRKQDPSKSSFPHNYSLLRMDFLEWSRYTFKVLCWREIESSLPKM